MFAAVSAYGPMLVLPVMKRGMIVLLCSSYYLYDGRAHDLRFLYLFDSTVPVPVYGCLCNTLHTKLAGQATLD